jgi:subtilisin family serine protease
VAGAIAAALVGAAPAAAFTPSNTYFAKQWYLAQDHAFDAWPSPPTTLAPVKVAIVDSGIDCSLPDFANRIFAAESFVSGSVCNDTEGHGTIVAGEIAGDLGSNGVVGLAYSAELIVAKVVTADGTIPLGAEAKAIRWAANQGARVINLSFGAVRDPKNPSIDTYSQVEAQAVAYAQRKGALIVAAAGNSDEAPSSPWPYASWPAALPHVIGVGALSRTGDVPDFSDRDPTYVDLAAPGVDIFSTFPTALTEPQHNCAAQGYTDCATGDYVHPQGTSFSAPQVSAAAAVLFAVDPALTSSQVGTILERKSDDVNASNGCSQCATGRDRLSGWGRLDVASAVAAVNAGAIPPSDRDEPNDTFSQAWTLSGRKVTSLAATLDYWDDPIDTYKVKLRQHALVSVALRAKWRSARVHLWLLSATGTVVRGGHTAAGPKEHFSYRAPKAGWYYVALRDVRHGGGVYSLQVRRTAPPQPKHKPKQKRSA